ncbi:hypothetical protein A2U01_0044781, partial [Trifolium medium]|nr:hypothetical protein [Trifolium medium]
MQLGLGWDGIVEYVLTLWRTVEWGDLRQTRVDATTLELD